MGDDMSGLDDEVAIALTQALRCPQNLARLEKIKPIHSLAVKNSTLARRSKANRWYADDHGIVLHYPDLIAVCDSDFREFNYIDYSEKAGDAPFYDNYFNLYAVSYTHLTLPTIYSV